MTGGDIRMLTWHEYWRAVFLEAWLYDRNVKAFLNGYAYSDQGAILCVPAGTVRLSEDPKENLN